MKTQTQRITKAMVRRSHEAQFNGVDYQAITHEIANELNFEPNDNEIAQLESSPSPHCDCGFCKTVPWQD